MIKFRVRAKNGIGFGLYSEELIVIADTVPQYMNSPKVNVGANHINPRWIYLTWLGIGLVNETGGDAALYYGIEWD